MQIPKKSNFYWFFSLIGIWFLVAFIALLIFQNQLKTPNQVECTPPTPLVNSTQEEKIWEKFQRNNYSFEYPENWHVALLSTTGEKGITIALDPSPIDTTLKGQPLAQITILDKSGLTSPETTFQKDRQNFKKQLNNLQEEKLETTLGEAYHYTSPTVDRYYFLLQPSGVVTPTNFHLLTIERTSKPQETEVFEHLIKSLRKENQINLLENFSRS